MDIALPAPLRLLSMEPSRAIPLLLLLPLAIPRGRFRFPDLILLTSAIPAFMKIEAKWRPPLEILPYYFASIPAILFPFSLGYFLVGWRERRKFLSSFVVGFFLQGVLYLTLLSLGIHRWFSVVSSALIALAALTAYLRGWRPSYLIVEYDFGAKLSAMAYLLTVSLQLMYVPALHGDMWTYHARAFSALDSLQSFLYGRFILPYPPLHTLFIASSYMLSPLPLFNSSVLFLSLGPAVLVQSLRAFYSRFTSDHDWASALVLLGGGLGGVLYWFVSVGSAEDLLNMATHVSEYTGDMLRGATQSKFQTPVASSLGLAFFLCFLSLPGFIGGLSLAVCFLTHFLEAIVLLPVWLLSASLGFESFREGLRKLSVALAVILAWLALDGGYLSYFLKLKILEASSRLPGYAVLGLVSFILLLPILRRGYVTFSRAAPYIGLAIFSVSFYLWLTDMEKLPPIESMAGRDLRFISSAFFLLLLIPSLLRRGLYSRAKAYFWAIAFTYFAVGMIYWGERTMEFAQLGLAPLCTPARRSRIWPLLLLLIVQSSYGHYTARAAESLVPIYNSSPSELEAFEWLEERNASILVLDGYTAQHNALLYRGLMDLRVAPLFGASAPPPGFPGFNPPEPNPQDYRFMSLALVNGMTIGNEEFTHFALRKLNVSYIYINRRNLELHQRHPALFGRWSGFLPGNLSRIADLVWSSGDAQIWKLRDLREVDIDCDAVATFLLVNGSVRGRTNVTVNGELRIAGDVEVRGSFQLLPCGDRVCVIARSLLHEGRELELRSSDFTLLSVERDASLIVHYGMSGSLGLLKAEDSDAEALMVVIYRLDPFRTKVWRYEGRNLSFSVDLLTMNVTGNLTYLRDWSHPDLGNWSECWIQVKSLKGGKAVREVSVKVRREFGGAVIPLTEAALSFESIGGDAILMRAIPTRVRGESYLFSSAYALRGPGRAEVTFPQPIVLKLTRC